MRAQNGLLVAGCWLLVMAATALPSPAPAGEPGQDPAKAKAREVQAAKLRLEIEKMERWLSEVPRERAIKTKNGDQAGLERLENGLKVYGERLPIAKAELAWLKGELTTAKATAAVKTAEEALAKAPEADKAKAQAALDQARKDLETVKGLEARGEF